MPSRIARLFKHATIAYRRLANKAERALMRADSLIQNVSDVLMVFAATGSLVCIIALVIHAGYDHSPSGYIALHKLLRCVQWVFAINVLFNLTFNLRNTLKNTKSLKWVVDIALLTTLLPALYPHPDKPWLPWLEQILYSNLFLYAVLAAYSIVTLSFALYKIIDRRTNPSMLLSLSFVTFIIIGTLLLMLPKSTYSGISFVDALFVSTSAVCVTGLTTVDVPSTFTPLGLSILAILIQIGALGVITFTSFFALFFSGSASIYSQLMLRDVIYSRSMNSLIPTLLYILAFTVSIEIAGALMVFTSIHGTMGMDLSEEMVFSGFHSLSSFCNAGFSNLPDGMASPLLLGRNNSIYWITTLLIVAGSIGFPILVNFKDAISYSISRKIKKLRHKPSGPRNVHQFDMNTKIVLLTFFLLFAMGTVIFMVLEYSNTLSGMTLWGKVTQSAFNSAVPRSAGFSSVNPASFLDSTLLMVLLLMWIGGGAQSTGGGIKVNTLAAIWLNLKAIVTSSPSVTAFKRTIATASIRRANAVVALSIFSYFLLSFLLLGLEPQLSARDILFESSSALFTVGSSLGVTPHLCPASKYLLCIAMFLGRVGIVSLLSGIASRRKASAPTYPSDNIIIN